MQTWFLLKKKFWNQSPDPGHVFQCHPVHRWSWGSQGPWTGLLWGSDWDTVCPKWGGGLCLGQGLTESRSLQVSTVVSPVPWPPPGQPLPWPPPGQHTLSSACWAATRAPCSPCPSLWAGPVCFCGSDWLGLSGSGSVGLSARPAQPGLSETTCCRSASCPKPAAWRAEPAWAAARTESAVVRIDSLAMSRCCQRPAGAEPPPRRAAYWLSGKQQQQWRPGGHVGGTSPDDTPGGWSFFLPGSWGWEQTGGGGFAASTAGWPLIGLTGDRQEESETRTKEPDSTEPKGPVWCLC